MGQALVAEPVVTALPRHRVSARGALSSRGCECSRDLGMVQCWDIVINTFEAEGKEDESSRYNLKNESR